MQAAQPDHEWVLCLDDDVVVHPDTLQQLVQGMKSQDAFMATGLPCRQVLCHPVRRLLCTGPTCMQAAASCASSMSPATHARSVCMPACGM